MDHIHVCVGIIGRKVYAKVQLLHYWQMIFISSISDGSVAGFDENKVPVLRNLICMNLF